MDFSWYQEFDFMDFFISRIRFLDIKKWILDIRKSNYWCQEILKNSKTEPQNIFHDNKKPISWYQEMISWYQEFDFFLYQEMFLFLYIKKCFYFFISRNRVLDIKKSISWCREMYFLISRNQILDIMKCWLNSKTAPHTARGKGR